MNQTSIMGTPEPLSMRDLLTPACVVLHLEANSKKAVLQELANQAAAHLDIDAATLFSVLWEREKLGTTGVGGGIAIPHGRVAGVDTVCGFFARLSAPVEFDAVDNRPVDLVFLLVAPEQAGADHLRALAAISRLMRRPGLSEQLRTAKDEGALYRLLTETAAAEAA